MPISVEWDNDEKTIICVTYTDLWTWDEAYAARSNVLTLAQTVPQVVDVVHDMRCCELIPRGALTHVRDMLSTPSARGGILAVVGTGRLLQTLYMLFSGLYARLVEENNLKLVATLEEAYLRIAEAQASRSERIS